MISQATRDFVRDELHLTFTHEHWLEEALYASTKTTIGGREVNDGNKRLALVGDRVLDLVLADDCYQKRDIRSSYCPSNDLEVSMTDWAIGESSIRSQECARNENLTKVGRKIGLHKHIVVKPPMVEAVDKQVATAMEALVGALYYDSERELADVKAGVIALGVFETAQSLTGENLARDDLSV